MKLQSLIIMALLASTTALPAQWLKPPRWVNPPKKPATLNAGTMRQQAEGGVASAQTGLGDLYMQGSDEMPRDEKTAVIWYRKAAEQGFAEAQSDLGDCYLFGIGVKKDEREAARWFEKAAAQGYPMAEYNLGAAFEEGRGEKRDPAKALEWYRAAADHGLPVAQFYLGSILLQASAANKEDAREAVALIFKAANSGLPQAQLGMGAVYEKGLGVDADLPAALDWYKKAAEQGALEARLRLGRAYLAGEGVAENPDLALQELLQIDKTEDAAVYASAQSELDRLCRRVRAIHGPDPSAETRAAHPATDHCRIQTAEAPPAGGKKTGRLPPRGKPDGVGYSPLEISAEQGDAIGQLQWGRELLRPGARRDPRLAWAWLALAAERGDAKKNPALKAAGKILAATEKELGPERTEKARKLADAWRARHAAP